MESTKWDSILHNIAILYSEYSAKDVASSLFISSLWLPNNGSTIKHLLLTTLFAAQQPNVFSKTDKITSYSEFKKFCEELYKLTPSFPSLEDYIPNYDWGTVKFHHQSENYRIFYGTEISHIYDFLVAFQLVYTTFDGEYETLSGRSPNLELKQCLFFQDKIIEGITTQPNEDKMTKIELGHIEVAPKKFWLQASALFNDLCYADISDLSGKEDYVAELGSIKPEVLNLEVFGDNAFEGTLLPTYFISDGDNHFPVLPRRYSGILIEKWSKIFSKHGAGIRKEKFDYQETLSLRVANFLEQRFYEGRFFPAVSALYPDNKPHEILFAGYILSEDKLALIYITKPYSSKEEIEKELEELKPKLQEALTLISKEPITLGLHTKRKTVVYESTVPDKKLKVELFVVLPQATTKLIPVAASKDFPGDIVFIDQFLGVMDEIEKHEEVSEFIDYLRDVEGKINVPITTLLDKFGSFRDSLGVLIPGANEPNMVMIDLQWGNDFRYKSLKSFWELYPESEFLDHPRSWKVKQETPTRVRLSAKNILGCVIYTKILSTGIFITSPLDLQGYEQGSMSNLLMECLEDYLSRFNELISNHRFFKRYKSLDVVIFPNVLLE